jgi:hypothetical protein
MSLRCSGCAGLLDAAGERAVTSPSWSFHARWGCCARHGKRSGDRAADVVADVVVARRAGLDSRPRVEHDEPGASVLGIAVPRIGPASGEMAMCSSSTWAASRNVAGTPPAPLSRTDRSRWASAPSRSELSRRHRRRSGRRRCLVRIGYAVRSGAERAPCWMARAAARAGLPAGAPRGACARGRE